MNVDNVGTWYNVIERFFIHFNLLIDHICVDFLIILIYKKTILYIITRNKK